MSLWCMPTFDRASSRDASQSDDTQSANVGRSLWRRQLALDGASRVTARGIPVHPFRVETRARFWVRFFILPLSFACSAPCPAVPLSSRGVVRREIRDVRT